MRSISSNVYLEHRNLSPPPPSRWLLTFFSSCRRVTPRTALSLHSIPRCLALPRISKAVTSSCGVLVVRVDCTSWEPATNERTPLNRATESARAEKIGAARRDLRFPRLERAFRNDFLSPLFEKKKYVHRSIDRHHRRERSTCPSRRNAWRPKRSGRIKITDSVLRTSEFLN